MAYLKWAGLDEVYREMQQAGATAGETAQRMIEAGGQECVKAWKLAIGMHGYVKTGAMQQSVGIKFVNKNGRRCAEIYPMGKDSRGIRNAEKAFILHYGRSNLPGDHFVDEAEQIAEAEAIPVMTEIWNQSK